MRFKHLAGLVPALIILVTASPALSAASEADQTKASAFIQKLADDTITVLQDKSESAAKREAQFRALMDSGFNVEFISRLVLGRYWRTATDAQKTAYSEIFGDFMLHTIMDRLDAFTNQTLSVTGTAPAGRQDIMVDSEVKGGDQPVLLQWRVRLFDGAPKVIDVKAEGVSMVVTNREDFGGIIQQKGMDAFIDALRTKTAELKAKEPRQTAGQ